MDVAEIRRQIRAAGLGAFVDLDGEREIGREALRYDAAVCLLIEEIAPAADGLRERDSGHDHIGYGEEVHPLREGVYQHADNAAQYRAVNGEAAVAEIEYAEQYLARAHAGPYEYVEREHDVVQSCEYRAEGHDDEA